MSQSQQAPAHQRGNQQELKSITEINILAATVIADILKTSLGTRGLDKMLVNSLGDTIITNDGATILSEIDVQHPAAKLLVEIAQTTDNEVGDGTTSTAVITGFLLKRARNLLDQDVHPTLIVDGYKRACEKALEILEQIAHPVDGNKDILKKIAMTSMASKITKSSSDYLSDLVVEAISNITKDGKLDIKDVLTVKNPGKSMEDSSLLNGVVVDKEPINILEEYPAKCKLLLVSSPLEIEKTENTATINLTNPVDLQKHIDMEMDMIRDKFTKIKNSGAKLVICQKGIDDSLKGLLTKHGILAIRRVTPIIMNALSKLTGSPIIEDLDTIDEKLKTISYKFETINTQPHVVILKDGKSQINTIMIRGGSQRVVDEIERSLHDALMAVYDVTIEPSYVYGCGSSESYIASELREWAKSVGTIEQMAVEEFANALENYTLLFAQSCGMNILETKVKLRTNPSYGIDVVGRDVVDVSKSNIYDPVLVKKQILKSSTEATCMILRVDNILASSPAPQQ